MGTEDKNFDKMLAELAGIFDEEDEEDEKASDSPVKEENPENE